MIADFYDIESLSNVWTLANYQPYKDHIDLFILCDTPELYQTPNFYQQAVDAIHNANKNFTGTVTLYDMHDPQVIEFMAKTFGLSTATYINNPNSPHDKYRGRYRIICDTDPGYDDNKHPYYMGYNSQNYDTTMLALLFERSVQITASGDLRIVPPSAAELRVLNNIMFDSFRNSMPDILTRKPYRMPNGTIGYQRPDYQTDGYKIRKNMLMSGRHVDVARLNDKASKVALKRLLGMLGGQILESDKLGQGQDTVYTTEELLDLIAYNVSDVVNLKLVLFDHSVYQGQFNLKKNLLVQYPELIYNKKFDKYEPEISPYSVRRDRLFIDSSSAQLATKALCPYEHLADIPVVSFMYPSEQKAKELGVPRVNVLEKCREFFYSKFSQPEIRAEFDKIYAFYKNIEGKNFNESKNYAADYALESTGCLPGPGESPNYPISEYPYGLIPYQTSKIPKTDTCMCYYNKDGTPSTCFVTFSIGGIHGAEYNKMLYENDLVKHQIEQNIMAQVQAQYPNPIDLKAAKHVIVKQPDENGNIVEIKYPAGKFLKSGSTLKSAAYKPPAEPPKLFKLKSDSITLNPDYVYTSADPTNHEDFTSYYPNLLRMLSAFYNPGLGYDRYAEIFDQKQDLGVLMKDKNADYKSLSAKTDNKLLARYEKLRRTSGCHTDPDVISDEERAVYAVQREGTKLVLNSASGAADATFESNIRMNNVIISMRIIGQLFSWRIGQAQTYEGAKITSTNTDGLFSVMESELNNKILEKESADINVEIEPEPTFLISKDTNNRIEMNPNTGMVQAASGGTLGCRNWVGKKGPQPTKNLSHPAILDWALCEYLVFASTDKTGRASLEKPFNPEVGLNILLSAKNKMDKIRLLNMFQNVIASSPGSIRYNFAMKPNDLTQPIPMQHYNRVFIMTDGTPNTVHLAAAVARKLTPVQIKNRTKNNERLTQHDPMAVDVLTANGVPANKIPELHEATISKLTNIESDWFMLIENRALKYIPDSEVDFILDNLDYGKYLYLLGESFEKSWRNIMPNAEPKTNLQPFTKDLQTAMNDYKNIKTPVQPQPANTTPASAESAENPVNKITPVEIQLPDDQQATPADTAIQDAMNVTNITATNNTPGEMLPWPEDSKQDPKNDKPDNDRDNITAMLLEMLAICDNILDGSQDNDSIQAIRTRIQTLLDAQT